MESRKKVVQTNALEELKPRRDSGTRGKPDSSRLTCELAKKFLLVHVILEGFPAVDKNDRDLIVEFAAKFGVPIDIDFAPSEPSASREFGKALLHDLAEVTSLARIDDNLSRLLHAWIVSLPGLLLARKKK